MIPINIEKLTDGILLIGIGILFLLSNLGIIHWSIWGAIINLWPLILIIIGTNILLKNKPLVVAATWILFFAILVTYGFLFQEKHEERSIAANEVFSVIKTEETTHGKASLNIGGTNLNITSDGRHLIHASINPSLIKSDLQFRNNKQEAVLRFDTIKSSVSHIGSSSEHYTFKLNDTMIWQVDAKVGAVSGDLDFSSLLIEKLDLSVGAGNLHLIFGDLHEKSDIKISAGASNIDILLPEDAGVKLKLNGLVSKGNVESLGWQKIDDFYYSPAYHTAESKLHFDISMGVGRLNVDLK
ncbi:hypothetical protein SAMN05660297_03322 [Natronincola peptidivorans]|uniref:LiaI-LiaF-like transmembrane region domain-containing protein n=1 Tax=Natronincola peptidivorans TaxID=426128 RepID=A0A1I0GRC0_9FIRM|nr:DUF5668 domain-containing protein [Natronincola peptidivorans]SET73592.1 hypothetical protein SAMN05660297_03322 [Natronincola peptidivorans]